LKEVVRKEKEEEEKERKNRKMSPLSQKMTRSMERSPAKLYDIGKQKLLDVTNTEKEVKAYL